MLAAHPLSPRGLALARTFAAAFEALREHGKSRPDEMQQLYEFTAAHLRAAAPMTLAALPDPVLESGELP